MDFSHHRKEVSCLGSPAKAPLMRANSDFDLRRTLCKWSGVRTPYQRYDLKRHHAEYPVCHNDENPDSKQPADNVQPEARFNHFTDADITC